MLQTMLQNAGCETSNGAGVTSQGTKQLKLRNCKSGNKVAFVGDGINDAPALTTADIGMAIGAGTDMAIKSTDIILVKSDQRDVIQVIPCPKRLPQDGSKNLVWATGYNVEHCSKV